MTRAAKDRPYEVVATAGRLALEYLEHLDGERVARGERGHPLRKAHLPRGAPGLEARPGSPKWLAPLLARRITNGSVAFPSPARMASHSAS